LQPCDPSVTRGTPNATKPPRGGLVNFCDFSELSLVAGARNSYCSTGPYSGFRREVRGLATECLNPQQHVRNQILSHRVDTRSSRAGYLRVRCGIGSSIGAGKLTKICDEFRTIASHRLNEQRPIKELVALLAAGLGN